MDWFPRAVPSDSFSLHPYHDKRVLSLFWESVIGFTLYRKSSV